MHVLLGFAPQKGMLGYYKMPACLCQELFSNFLLISIYFLFIFDLFLWILFEIFSYFTASEMLSRHISDIDTDSFSFDFFSRSQCFDLFLLMASLRHFIFLKYIKTNLLFWENIQLISSFFFVNKLHLEYVNCYKFFQMLHRSADRMFVDLLSESFLFWFLFSWNLSCLDSLS